MGQAICVYCSSSNHVDRCYFDLAHQFGQALGRRGDTLVFGGDRRGLMGTVARATAGNGGQVIGVMPKFMAEGDSQEPVCHEIVITEGMRERKALMEERSDAYVALPGGLGTLEELVEILNLRQLRRHDKPVVLLNASGFYDKLLAFFDHLYELQFAREKHRRHLFIASGIDEALAHVGQGSR